jgi:hypothetical protein
MCTYDPSCVGGLRLQVEGLRSEVHPRQNLKTLPEK